ncbi:MAG: amino acid permease [Actinomycetota bacterium]
MAQTTTPTNEQAGGGPASESANGGRVRKRKAQPPSTGYALKRAVLGRPLPTANLAHERLGKITALAVFSSDALSSVAYATEELLRIFAVAGVGIAMFALVTPVSGVIVLVLVTLMFSYRQTIKAYPSAGGAYIVTKDNFGLLPAQVAGVALLTDYVLTVAVSISAGVAAIVSADTALYPFRVPIALAFLLLLIWGNLRGVKESGRLFAAPTYIFILSVFTLLIVAGVRLASGALQPLPHPSLSPEPMNAGLLFGVSLFIVLKALASGSTAMTGVEAISNGVPAFRPPEWRNARTTLVVMGSILGTMFLGISYLAHRLQVYPDLTEKRTVISMIARAAFGTGGLGHVMFLILQIATMAILVLAANTSFADFPRLANFHAGDAFLPRQFTQRGHRLVFSNGIVSLGAAAALLIVLFQANVSRLIPFYAIGVFTSFTMSQAGMARRHLRLREPGWRRGLLINGFGAFATGVVDIVIAVTKFPDDVAIIVLVPVVVWLLVRMNHLYQREARELDHDVPPWNRSVVVEAPTVVVLVERLDRPTLHALQYARTIRTRRVIAVHVDADPERTRMLREQWEALHTQIPLEIVERGGGVPETIAGFVRALPGESDVSVILPAPGDPPFGERVRRSRLAAQIAKELLDIERARLTVVRDHPGPGHTDGASPRIAASRSHRAVVLVDKADLATRRAVKYALSLGADEVSAVHAAADLDVEQRLIERWMELRMPIPLDVIECWDRNVPRSLEQYVVEMMSHRYEVTVVMPRRDYATLRQRVLHDRTSRRIARAVGRYEHVDVAVVPYFFRHANGHADGHGDGHRDGRNGHKSPTSEPPGVSHPGASVPSTDGATGRPPGAR